MQNNTSSIHKIYSIPPSLRGKDLDLHVLKDYSTLIGIDEVGRGCLAGPVVSCALILNPAGFEIPGLNDSKKLSEAKRTLLFPQILTYTKQIGIGLSFVDEIDEINIFEATKLSMFRAIYNLELPSESEQDTILLVDGLYLPHPTIRSCKLIKGDTKSPSIMAASIIAKVVRDELMRLYHKRYPEYKLEQNKGYGTLSHREKIISGKYTPIHRKSFMPLKDFVHRSK